MVALVGTLDSPARAAAPAPLTELKATIHEMCCEWQNLADMEEDGTELAPLYVWLAERVAKHVAALDGREACASCWAIERDIQSRLHYWAGRNGDDWRQDNGEALRFDRRADAELMLTYHCAGIGRVVEHIWHDGLPAPPARPQPAGEAT